MNQWINALQWLKEPTEEEFKDLEPIQEAIDSVYYHRKRTPEQLALLETAEQWFSGNYTEPFLQGIKETYNYLEENIKLLKLMVANILTGLFKDSNLRINCFLPVSIPGAVDRLLDSVLKDAEEAGIPMEELPGLKPEDLKASRIRRGLPVNDPPSTPHTRQDSSAQEPSSPQS